MYPPLGLEPGTVSLRGYKATHPVVAAGWDGSFRNTARTEERKISLNWRKLF